MDDSHFDDLVRALATRVSQRRGTVRLLTGGVLGALGAALGLTEAADAKRKKKGKGKGKGKGKKKKKTPPPAGGCSTGTSACAGEGECIPTELCCSLSSDCPAAINGVMECDTGVCDCNGTKPGQFANGDYYCCIFGETVCNGGCCRSTCTVQAGNCECPGGSGPCQGEEVPGSGVSIFSCCATGDTCCYATGVECCTTACTDANSTRGEPQTFCDPEFSCRCMTRIDNGEPVCMNIIGGPTCSPNCPTNGCDGLGEICVDSVSCDSSQTAPACGTPCL